MNPIESRQGAFHMNPSTPDESTPSPDTPLTPEGVRGILATIADPETGRPVTQTSQVKDVSVTGSRAHVQIGLTPHSLAPVRDRFAAQVRERLLAGIAGLDQVEVELVGHERPVPTVGQVGLRCRSVIAVGSGERRRWQKHRGDQYRPGPEASRVSRRLDGRRCLRDPAFPTWSVSMRNRRKPETRFSPSTRMGCLSCRSVSWCLSDEAVIWRGPMLHSAVTQFLRDTDWGELDYLIIDMPPGTGDVALTLSQLMPATGAVVVCTPQKVALLDAIKALKMLEKVRIPTLGIVENMSSFICPDCNRQYDIFGKGGARKLAEQANVPLLAELPIEGRRSLKGEMKAQWKPTLMTRGSARN